MAKINWIKKAINPAHKGMLHKDLGVPQGETIPESKLEEASERGGKVGQRARLAATLRGLRNVKIGGK